MTRKNQTCEAQGCNNPLPDGPRIAHNRRFCSERCNNNPKQRRFRIVRRGYLSCEHCGERNYV